MALLPIFQTALRELSMLQTQWSSQLNPLINLPIANGFILKDVQLTTGTNTINHRLGRDLSGWILVRQRGAASIYDNQDNNQKQNLTLLLVSSASVNVDIYVF